MTDTSTTSADPARIEDEVERTQDAIGDTVERIEEKLSPRELSRSLIGGDNSDLAEDAIEVARTNPIPVAMIAVGLIWLLASSRAPAVRRVRERITGKGGSQLRSRSQEPAPIGPSPRRGERFDRRAKA